MTSRRLDECAAHTQEDFLRLFGEISVLFATWDLIVTGLFFRLANRSHRSLAGQFTGEITLVQKLKLLEQLCPNQVIDGSVLERVHALLPEAVKVGKERNRYIHDQWEFNQAFMSNGQIRRFTITGYDETMWLPRIEEQRLSIRDLEAFLSEIGGMQKKFGVLHDELKQRSPDLEPKNDSERSEAHGGAV